MLNLEEQGGEAKAVGWISMADMFMLCSIVMLAVAVSFALSLKRTDSLLSTSETEFSKFRNINSLTVDELKSSVASFGRNRGDYRAQAATLDQQLKQLKLQFDATERQLAHFRDESAKYKAHGESLTAELGVQTSKLNSVQSEFDKYRNINTLSISDLKTELLRLTKSVDDYKLKESELQNRFAASEKLALGLRGERDKFQAESERLASELAKVNGDMTRLAADLTKSAANKDQLLADLTAAKSAFATLQKADNDLKLQISVIEADKKKLEGKVADLEGSIIGLTGEIGELKPQLEKLKVDLTGAKLRIIDLEKAVFETINRAKLVITITAQDVPKDFTLELFVTDPLSNECGPFSSVIFNEGDEIGVLQQSVDFKSGREGSQKAVFYSLRPVLSNSVSGTYMVKAMIRHNGNDESVQLPGKVMVQCNVDLPYVKGPDGHKVATREINTRGYIKKVKRNGQLTPSTQFKNMWPWEPVYHFERILCDFRVEGDRITNLRTYEALSAETAAGVGPSTPITRDAPEQRIDSIRNRSGN